MTRETERRRMNQDLKMKEEGMKEREKLTNSKSDEEEDPKMMEGEEYVL